jgi:hypothetical protein
MLLFFQRVVIMAFCFITFAMRKASFSFHYRQALSNPALQRIDAQSRVNR